MHNCSEMSVREAWRLFRKRRNTGNPVDESNTRRLARFFVHLSGEPNEEEAGTEAKNIFSRTELGTVAGDDMGVHPGKLRLTATWPFAKAAHMWQTPSE